MAFIKKRRGWTSQPPLITKLANPYREKAGALIVPSFSGAFESVSQGVIATPSAAVIPVGVAQNGVALDFSGVDPVYWIAGYSAASILQSATEFLVVLSIVPRTLGGNDVIFANHNAALASSSLAVWADNSGSVTGNANCLSIALNGAGARIETAANTLAVGRQANIVISYKGGSHIRTWINGVVKDGVSSGSIPASLSGGFINLFLGDCIGLDGFDGFASLIYIGGKACKTQDEERDLSLNPWRLFEDQTIGVPVSAGGGGTTISATPGNAIADGTTASVTRTIPATPGNASADGITASVVRVIGAAPGNAAADGTTAAITRTIATTPGNATADGVTATVTNSGTTTISATPGNAVADGVTAAVTRTIAATPGNAVANGITAGVTRVIATTPGNAVADGITASIQSSVTISCTPGNAVADGVIASILTGTVHTISVVQPYIVVYMWKRTA